MSFGHVLTTEELSRGGHASVAARNANTIRRGQRITQTVELLNAIDTTEPSQLGQKLLETALTAAAKLDETLLQLSGDSTLDAVRLAQVVDAVVKVQRLLTGQSTSNVAHAHVDPAVLAERLTELQSRSQRVNDASDAHVDAVTD